MKNLFLALTLFAFLFSHSQSYSYTGRVVKIKDGDTITVLDTLKKENTVRFASVDAPEKKQEFGSIAKQFVSQELFNKTVRVDIISIDIFKRPIGYVYYDDNKNISEVLLTKGLAWHFYDKSEFLEELEKKARIDKLGLWVIQNPVEPCLFRHPKKAKKTK
ncbi:thermonuclease family protein [Flavobacterium sp.]|uniref:thermonuclease family protein n=1 Tax=Flavobacterium sp. TaxID=239 RepID=UPI00374FF780